MDLHPLLVVALLPLAGAAALDIAPDRPATVVLATDATPAERTAAHEVADYLGRVTGATLAVVAERDATATSNRILVGPTSAARRQGIDVGRLAPEAWVVRTDGSDLLLVGGRPRGTLYAAYHFLESAVGVRWWNPWEESVPSRPRLTFNGLDLRGQPAFRYRDVYMLYGRDNGRFAARSRLNRDGDAPIDGRFGGCLDYGPPYHVHTFYRYFPPEEHFAQHPEWYSLLDGHRTGDGAQLCLTNTELRTAFAAKLLSNIETSWAAARAANEPPPLVFDISQNDWANPCQCPSCQAIAKAEGSEAGPLLDFVNAMADAAKTRYPDVYIDTLAYQYTQAAPRTIRPRDNVIIRLCDTEADMLKPITAPENRAFADHIRSWAAIARNLRIWDYAVTYGTPLGMPLPSTQTYGPDFRFYLANHVEGVFTELEYEVLADLRDFKVWLMAKMLEDPEADYDRLTETFMNGFYGPAGPLIRQYLRGLEDEAAARASRSTCWQGSPSALSYLSLESMTRWQTLFDQAEQAVAADAVLLRRVRHARLALDRATLAADAALRHAWRNQGGDAARFPFDREAVARRALATWHAAIEQRLPEDQRAQAKLAADGEIQRFALLPTTLGLPARFGHLPRGTVFDYTAVMTRNWMDEAKVVKDPEAESGVTNRLDLTAPGVGKADRYTLPMAWGLYGTLDKRTLVGEPIRAEDVPGPGYHWYRMGAYPVQPGYYLYFFWSWVIQLDVDNVHDPARPEQPFEVWARIKFEGPRFPHGRPADHDAICVERVVLVRSSPPAP